MNTSENLDSDGFKGKKLDIKKLVSTLYCHRAKDKL